MIVNRPRVKKKISYTSEKPNNKQFSTEHQNAFFILSLEGFVCRLLIAASTNCDLWMCLRNDPNTEMIFGFCGRRFLSFFNRFEKFRRFRL